MYWGIWHIEQEFVDIQLINGGVCGISEIYWDIEVFNIDILWWYQLTSMKCSQLLLTCLLTKRIAQTEIL